MKRLHYTLIFRPEPEGGFSAMAPSLPGCVTYGENLQKARKNALDAIDGYIKSLIKHNESIPSDEINLITSLDFELPSSKKITYA